MALLQHYQLLQLCITTVSMSNLMDSGNIIQVVQYINLFGYVLNIRLLTYLSDIMF